ncbi:MAG: glucose-6-phosphate dehydrogenase [Deltaproteobacteria bacterium]|nr:glucose-6-phosphate dehydrogenase [Deltaproteobacteria bacterium]
MSEEKYVLNADFGISAGLFNKRPLKPATFVIFGATGDLTMRKLVPGLYNLFVDNQLPEDFTILGVARSKRSLEDFKSRLKTGVEKYSRSGFNSDDWEKLAGRIGFFQMDYDLDESYFELSKLIEIEDDKNKDRSFLFYLATPPASFAPILSGLGKHGLITPEHLKGLPHTRVVVEKPFGRDTATALELNSIARMYLDEEQLFRMDHYLGKETVQNLLIFRFANAIFEPIWNRRYVQKVRITAFEKIGIEGRGRFYEETGIVRDVLQNHLLQIMALCAMEAPSSFDAERIRDERAKVFNSIRPLNSADTNSVSLGRYKGYLDEKDVSPDSKTPTYASVKMFIDNWRWEGVPFILSTGKALSQKMTQVEIYFAPVPLCLFEDKDVCTKLEPNVLTIRIQPEEGITLKIGAKTPGEKLDVSPVNMHFDFNTSFKGKAQQEAYEKLLLDCLKGNQTLFARQDEVERMWKFVAPLLEGAKDGSIEIKEYDVNSDGPEVKP